MRQARGMSLLELVIALAISVMLFTAVASAIHASSNSMKANERYFKATQTARIAMLQITTMIRQSYSCQPGSQPPLLEGNGPLDWPDTTILKIRKPNPAAPEDPLKAIEFAYRFDAAKGALRYCTNPDAISEDDPVLAANVTQLSFRAQSWKRLVANAPPDATLDAYGEWVLGNIQIDMTVTVDNTSLRLSNSVVPRKAMTVR